MHPASPSSYPEDFEYSDTQEPQERQTDIPSRSSARAFSGHAHSVLQSDAGYTGAAEVARVDTQAEASSAAAPAQPRTVSPAANGAHQPVRRRSTNRSSASLSSQFQPVVPQANFQGSGVITEEPLSAATDTTAEQRSVSRISTLTPEDSTVTYHTPTPRRARTNAVIAERMMPKEKKPVTPLIVGVVAVVVVLAAIGWFAWSNIPISLTVNGQSVSLPRNTTLATLVEKGYASPTPGNLLAVDGSVLEEGGGSALSATVNGVETTDENLRLNDGEVIQIENGVDETEPYTSSKAPINAPVTIEGVGAMHVYTSAGAQGESEVRVGDISGLSSTVVLQEAQPAVVTRYNIDTGGEKVIALTFDDGPWPDSTNAILDTLAQYNAKATFFTIGQQISGGNFDSIKRAASEGHQISTHTWDHAAGSGRGVDLGHMTAEERINEVQQGYAAIAAATDAPVSTEFRSPGGNFNEETASILMPYVSAEVGWNIDTEDWRRPGTQAIVNQLLRAKPGYIILMHDGGGTRSQTVEALQQALPVLAEQGYRFVTVNELLSYDSRSDGNVPATVEVEAS